MKSASNYVYRHPRGAAAVKMSTGLFVRDARHRPLARARKLTAGRVCFWGGVAGALKTQSEFCVFTQKGYARHIGVQINEIRSWKKMQEKRQFDAQQ